MLCFEVVNFLKNINQFHRAIVKNIAIFIDYNLFIQLDLPLSSIDSSFCSEVDTYPLILEIILKFCTWDFVYI